MVPKRRVHPLIKAAVAIALLAGVALLFVRSVKDARAEPYIVNASQLRTWTLGIDTAADADGAVVSLRPQPELPMNLFRQLFSRQMESLGTTSQPGIALVLRREIPSGISVESILAMARDAGLDRATPAPRCVGYRRVSDPGITRQLYFMWFDVPGFDRFRQALVPLAGAGFDPAGLSPAMIMAGEPNLTGWQPIVVDEGRDCVAPVKIE